MFMNKTYICADIHGDLDGYLRLLETIEYHESDHMIVAGDVMDRGKDGIALFNYVMEQPNTTLLLGNHEMFAKMYLLGELDGLTWSGFGGSHTLESIESMTYDERKRLLDELENLKLYEEADSTKYGRCVVTHTGIDLDNLVFTYDGQIDVRASIDSAYRNNTYSYMCGRDIHYAPVAILKELNQYLIVGHVPTYYINEDKSCNIYKSKYYMDIDCGRGKKEKTGRICCYDIADDQEIYIM